MDYNAARALVEAGRLVYTCNCGWIDLGHANPLTKRPEPYVGAQRLWNQILSESGKKSRDSLARGFKVTYGQDMSLGRVGLNGVLIGTIRDYWVRAGLAVSQKERVALAIFQEVSFGFESLQLWGEWGSRLSATTSGYSIEDLVSNLIGFYTAVRPHVDYIALAQPVGKEASLELLRKYPDTFSRKNRGFYRPCLYDCPSCVGQGAFPPELKQIAPATKGKTYAESRNWLETPRDDGQLFRDWSVLRDDIPKVRIGR